MDFLGKHHRQEPQEPQLAAMIDVFSILIIFLIAGTVMGTSSITLPKQATLPQSYSKEAIDTAPQITLAKDEIALSFDSRAYTRADLRAGGSEKERLKSAVSRFYTTPGKRSVAATSGAPAPLRAVHIVADKSLPYSVIFESVKYAREAGFESFYFVSSARGKGP